MSQFRFEEHKATSLRHKITDDIRKAIFTGQLTSGTKLREVEISKQMGISRGPIREAMRMLEQEGLLYSHPYKETIVAEISGEEVLEVLIPLRLTIEQFALRKALPRLNEFHLGRLRTMLTEMRDAARNRDMHKIVDCDLHFHEYLVNLSESSNLSGVWKSIYNRIRLFFITQAQVYEDLQTICDEHDVLLDAIAQGNPERAAEALTLHIHNIQLGALRNPM